MGHLVTQSLAGFLLALVVLVFGGVALVSRFPKLTVVAHAVAHSAAIGGGLVLLLMALPAHRKLFEDFGVELPSLTLLFLDASDVVWKLRHLLVPGALALYAVDWFLFLRLRSRPLGLDAGLYSGLVSMVLGVLFLAASISLILPVINITNDLS